VNRSFAKTRHTPFVRLSLSLAILWVPAFLLSGCGPAPNDPHFDSGSETTPSGDAGSGVDLESGPSPTSGDAGLAFPDSGAPGHAGDAGDLNDAGQGVDESDGGLLPPQALGTFEFPIVVNIFPSTHFGDTTQAPSDVADAYSPCAPNTPELGGEFVFQIEIPADLGDDRQFTASVDDVAGDEVDIDLHLLSALSADACDARDNRTLSKVVSAGDVLYLSADTWTNGLGEDLAGPFALSFSLTQIDPTQCLVNPIPSCTETSFVDVNGVPAESAGQGGCPDGMVKVADFCVDQFEAILVEDLGGGSLGPWSPFENPGFTSVRALSVAGKVPQGYISGDQAAAACANAGKRLCTDGEWLRACQGASGQTYPYGDSRQPGSCNDARTCHPAIQYFETADNWIWSELGHPCINQLPASVDATGQNGACTTEENLFDMMGNLHEWTSDPGGTFRGGFYADTAINGEGCLYATTAHNTGHWDYSTGFRCCADLP
jgi:hypothetical protein